MKGKALFETVGSVHSEALSRGQDVIDAPGQSVGPGQKANLQHKWLLRKHVFGE